VKKSAFHACLVLPALFALATIDTAYAKDVMPPELADALAGKMKGKVVTAFGPLAGDEALKFDETMRSFVEKTGIQFRYEGSKQFEATISTRVDAGNPPDIADFPQPGLLKSFTKAGKVADLAKVLGADYLDQQYAPAWTDISKIPGPDGKPVFAGIWERVNVKSLIWYPKKAFDAAGYKIPKTWDELKALQDQIVSDGDTPWCIGIESGVATGWPVTDWIEEVMLRTTSLENYDKWTEGKLKFDSPEVRHAVDIVGDIWLNDKYVYGGRKTIVSTSFGDGPTPMFANPPKCWMYHLGNFITSFFPKDAKAGVDYDFFYMPPIDPKYGSPVEVGGDIWAMFNDRPEVRAVMAYLTRGEHLKGWMATGGAIAPQKDAKLEWYGNAMDRGIAEILKNATSVRFDGSDLMPGEVGAGAFWREMTAWVAGTTDEETALKNIDAAWPKN